MALTEIELKKYSDALTYASKAVQLDSNSAEYLYTLGLISEKLNNIPSAIQAYKASIARNPKFILPRINLGKIYDENGTYDKALDQLLKAYQIDPESLAVNNNLGNVYLHSKLYKNSITHFKKAIAQKPNATLMRYNLALAYIATGDKAHAITALTELIKIDNTYWDAYYTLGKLLYAEKQQDKAKELFKALLAKKPDYSKRNEIETLIQN